MIKIAVVGDIGSGKTHVAKLFRYPVFNADEEVAKLYRKSRKCYVKFKKALPNYINSFPIKKSELSNALISKKKNLKKIIKIVHPEVRKKMNNFLKKNKNKKIVVLDIPLFLENKMNKRRDILVFVDSKKNEILKRLKKRKNYNAKLIYKFKKIQLPIEYKKKKSQFIIRNNFSNKFLKKDINRVLERIL